MAGVLATRRAGQEDARVARIIACAFGTSRAGGEFG